MVMTNNRLDIVARIRAELKSRKMTQKQLAESIGQHPVVVNDVIHCRRPNKKVREAIASTIGLPTSYLWMEEGINQPEPALGGE